MSTLLAAHLEWMRSGGKAKRTIRDRARLLTWLDQHLPEGIDRATTDELRAWLATDGWSAWTRSTYYQHVAGFYRWAVGGKDPWSDADLTKPRNPDADPHPATDRQVRDAIARADPRWQRAVVLAAYAGLRASEIAHLQREHVTADDITIWHGKGDRSLTVPCHPEIWTRVDPLGAGLVVPNDSGGPMNMSARAREHFDLIGLEGLHLHMLRHWYCVSLLRAGVDIRTVQGLMRHRSLQTTAMYLPLVDGQRRLAISTLPVLHNPRPRTAGPQQEAA
jgi:integrase